MVEASCSICFSELNLSSKNQAFRCYISYCQECFSQWVLSQARDSLSHLTTFRCPDAHCHHSISEVELKQKLTPDCQNSLTSLRNRRLLLHNPEAKRCPKSDCPGVGCPDGCSESLICPICNSSWSSPIERERDFTKSRPKKILLETERNELWKGLHTKDCPKCRVPIYKTEGCNKVLCQMCRTEFCWNCSGIYPRHNLHRCHSKIEAELFWIFFGFSLVGLRLYAQFSGLC